MSDTTPEPVSSKLQAARLLFRSAHALEEATGFLQIRFDQSLIKALIGAGWGHGIEEAIDKWRVTLVKAGTALIDEAIHEELEAGEAAWIAGAVRMRIDGERGKPVTFPLTEPHTEND